MCANLNMVSLTSPTPEPLPDSDFLSFFQYSIFLADFLISVGKIGQIDQIWGYSISWPHIPHLHPNFTLCNCTYHLLGFFCKIPCLFKTNMKWLSELTIWWLGALPHTLELPEKKGVSRSSHSWWIRGGVRKTRIFCGQRPLRPLHCEFFGVFLILDYDSMCSKTDFT